MFASQPAVLFELSLPVGFWVPLSFSFIPALLQQVVTGPTGVRSPGAREEVLRWHGPPD